MEAGWGTSVLVGTRLFICGVCIRAGAREDTVEVAQCNCREEKLKREGELLNKRKILEDYAEGQQTIAWAPPIFVYARMP